MFQQDTTRLNEELAHKITEQIQMRTWGRIKNLQVEVREGQIVVTGSAPTYYMKQLALCAVREVRENLPLQLNIAVEKAQGPLSLHELLAKSAQSL